MTNSLNSLNQQSSSSSSSAAAAAAAPNHVGRVSVIGEAYVFSDDIMSINKKELEGCCALISEIIAFKNSWVEDEYNKADDLAQQLLIKNQSEAKHKTGSAQSLKPETIESCKQIILAKLAKFKKITERDSTALKAEEVAIRSILESSNPNITVVDKVFIMDSESLNRSAESFQYAITRYDDALKVLKKHDPHFIANFEWFVYMTSLTNKYSENLEQLKLKEGNSKLGQYSSGKVGFGSLETNTDLLQMKILSEKDKYREEHRISLKELDGKLMVFENQYKHMRHPRVQSENAQVGMRLIQIQKRMLQEHQKARELVAKAAAEEAALIIAKAAEAEALAVADADFDQHHSASSANASSSSAAAAQVVVPKPPTRVLKSPTVSSQNAAAATLPAHVAPPASSSANIPAVLPKRSSPIVLTSDISASMLDVDDDVGTPSMMRAAAVALVAESVMPTCGTVATSVQITLSAAMTANAHAAALLKQLGDGEDVASARTLAKPLLHKKTTKRKNNTSEETAKVDAEVDAKSVAAAIRESAAQSSTSSSSSAAAAAGGGGDESAAKIAESGKSIVKKTELSLRKFLMPKASVFPADSLHQLICNNGNKLNIGDIQAHLKQTGQKMDILHEGWTPILLLALGGSVETFSAFIAEGYKHDLSIVSPLRLNALQLCCVNPNMNVGTITKKGSSTPFAKVVIRLRSLGININTPKMPPLHLASSRGFAVCVDALNIADINPNLIDHSGLTAGHYAAKHKDGLALEQWLRIPKVNPCILDGTGVLDLAKTHVENDKVLKELTDLVSKKNMYQLAHGSKRVRTTVLPLKEPKKKTGAAAE